MTSRYDPELVEAAPWLDALERAGGSAAGEIMGGLDPAVAVAIVAGTPVLLRLLKIVNEYTLAMIDDRKEDRALERERKRIEIEAERRRIERES